MKKLLYYSPYIPIIGIVMAFLSVVFDYETIIDELGAHSMRAAIIQGAFGAGIAILLYQT